MRTVALSETQKIQVKRVIAKVTLRGGTQEKAAQQIKNELGISLSQSQVSRYLSDLKAQWLANTQQDVATIRAKEIAELDALKEEVYNEWERSKLNAETTTTKTVGVDEKKNKVDEKKNKSKKYNPDSDLDEDPRDTRLAVEIEETHKVAGQCGDPRYITNLLNIQERKSKLLGLDAPVKQDITTNISAKTYIGVSPDDWDEIEKESGTAK